MLCLLKERKTEKIFFFYSRNGLKEYFRHTHATQTSDFRFGLRTKSFSISNLLIPKLKPTIGKNQVKMPRITRFASDVREEKMWLANGLLFTPVCTILNSFGIFLELFQHTMLMYVLCRQNHLIYKPINTLVLKESITSLSSAICK